MARTPPSLPPTQDPPAPAERPSPGRGGTRVVGMLGGIASGKSLAARLLAGEDGRVIDADREAHAVLASPEGLEFLRASFGPGVLAPDGAPDRRALGALAFRDPGALRTLEDWIHPRVRAILSARLAEAREQGLPLVALDVPLLLENDDRHGLVAECDALVFLEAPLPERERRARETRGWDPDELSRREALQVSLDEKQRRAHHILRNSGDETALRESALELRRWLLSEIPRR